MTLKTREERKAAFYVLLVTLYVVLGTIIWVRWQQCHSTEEPWLVNQINSQSHQAQLT